MGGMADDLGMPTANDYLSAAIRTRRKSLNRSQQSIADSMVLNGFTSWRQSTVNRLEYGQRMTTWDEALTLIRILSLDITKMSDGWCRQSRFRDDWIAC